MAAEYLTHTTAMAPAADGPAGRGQLRHGRLPNVNAHTVTGTVTVTECVPAPLPTTGCAGDPDHPQDGQRRHQQLGQHHAQQNLRTEYHVDLVDGYRAVYRPRAGATCR